MLLPVIERFAELGWRAFVEPGETYELFSVAGIFKRANIDANAAAIATDSGALLFVQRNALFDVCLRSGLAHLIVAYVGATTTPSLSVVIPRDGTSAVVGKNYVLKEPVAVQQWLRRRVELIEKAVHAEVGSFSSNANSTTNENGHKRHQKSHAAPGSLESHVRELSGLRAIAMALMERLRDGARQLEADAIALRSQHGGVATRHDQLLEQTELARLTSEGIQNLLEMLFRVQSTTLTCQCLQWFKDRQIILDADQFHEFYYQARSARASLRQSFEGSYDVVMSSISNSDIAFPSLLIELVMQNANVSQQLTLPPSSFVEMLKLLQSPAIHDDLANFYEVSHEPVEAYFRVPTALLLYFALDVAYVSASQKPGRGQQGWTGSELVNYCVDVADSFAAQMGVRADMKASLVAIWLIENAVNARLTSNEDVAPIYHSAVTRLLESSAMHLQKKSGLEAELILYMVETLVHRGESSFAWKIWTAFDMELSKLPPVATEYAVMVNLELNAWERALSLLRHQRRLDLLELVFKWLIKSSRMKELVHQTTLTEDEERRFDDFMMGGRLLGESVLHDGSIKKADLLVMYYVLRNQFDKAWAVHHEHLALIRASTSGHTNVAHAVLHQPSFQIRSALLQNMKTEPMLGQERSYRFRRGARLTRPDDTDILMIGSGSLPIERLTQNSADEDGDLMSDEVPASASSSAIQLQSREAIGTPQRPAGGASATVSASLTPNNASFTYSPGIFSSRSSQPRSSSKKLTASGATTTPVDQSVVSKVPIGSIDSTPTEPGAARRYASGTGSAKSVAQTLHFGNSSAITAGANENKSERFRQFVPQPMRNNSALSGDEVLSLKHRPATTKEVPIRGTETVSSDRGADSPATPKSSIATTASTASQDVALFETPKKFQFVREPPQTDSRVLTKSQDRSPATQELEAMELEAIDEEFSTPNARSARRKEPQSVPTRRNPRRTSRTIY